MSKKKKHALKPKKDTYQKRRGTPQFLDIICAQCQAYVLLYQKDGTGHLFRLYLDRIFAPAELAQLQNTVFSKGDMPQLTCPNGHLIGLPMIYEPEQRLAFSLVPGSFSKRKHQ